jgi:hypothetical protein
LRLPVGQLRDLDIGKKFVEIGYGYQDNLGTYGTRRTGKAELQARSGRIFEVMFGSFEAFRSWVETGDPGVNAPFITGPVGPSAFLPLGRSLPRSEGGAAGSGGAAGEGPSEPEGKAGGIGTAGQGGNGAEDPDAYLREIYESTILVEGYEAIFGGAPGDAQSCYGDSGSPIIRADATGNLVAYGVVSGGLGSNQLICDFGGVDATFGPDVYPFLQSSKEWVDPCAGLPIAGVCDDTIAKRCTSPVEGPRRPIEFDCSMLGQICATQPDGTAGCSDAAESED